MKKENELNRVFPLKNVVQHYAWGSKDFIPELLGIPNTTGEPFAELWMGSHITAPSFAVLDDNETISLRELIERDADRVLGRQTVKTFGKRLPFLFKVLAAQDPLSIQAHPTKQQALEGFTMEEMKGIPLASPQRNYKDTNHKPELLIALTDFSLLCGFRSWEDIKNEFERSDHSKPLRLLLEQTQQKPADRRLAFFFDRIMSLTEQERQDLIPGIVARMEGRSGPAYEWVQRLSAIYPHDIGVLAPLFLHTLRLTPGQAVHIPSGVLHSYLKGCGLEIMANSDNVLRGGLTRKHIDLPELKKVVVFAPREPEIIRAQAQNTHEFYYPLAVEEFAVEKIVLRDNAAVSRNKRSTAEIILGMRGTVRISPAGGSPAISIHKGESFFIPAVLPGYTLQGSGELYKVGGNS
jgi:mannose-6-phosphate isomerase